MKNTIFPLQCPLAQLALFISLTALRPLGADDTNLDADAARFPKLPDGFKVELIAAEPLIHNPVSMAFDRRGRLFVGGGSQFRRPNPATPGDSIKILIDDDGDGVIERTKTFAIGFNSIHGLVWKGNDLWVANAPDFTIVRDLDGDDEADEYVRVYTDLGNLEHSLHGLNWGPDGKLYMSKGNSKGLTQPGRIAPKPFRELWGVESPANAPDFPPIEVFKKGEYIKNFHNPADDWGRQGGILRCDDMGKNLEIVSAGFRNPWDITMDGGFNWLGTDNDQNEGDKIFSPFYGAHFGWGHDWSYNWLDPDHLPTVPHSGPFFHGSGTGIIHYGGDRFPENYRNVFFIGDWGRKCVYVLRPKWEGALLQCDVGDDPLEIFADSAGALFKPSDLEVAPDGSLLVLGWGNEYGTLWKDGVQKEGNQVNEGRAFRIWHKDAPPLKRLEWYKAKRDKPHTEWNVEELVDDLGHFIPSWRVDAQWELVRRGASVLPALHEHLTKKNLPMSEETWLAWTVGRIALGDDSIDQHFTVQVTSDDTLNRRLQAIRILSFRAREAKPAKTVPGVIAEFLNDPEPRVRFAAVQAIWQAKQAQFVAQLVVRAAMEEDRVTYYSIWGALRDLASTEELKSMLGDERGPVRRAALLALLDLKLIAPADAKPLQVDPDPGVATLANLYISKVEEAAGNVLAFEPNGGEFVDAETVKIISQVKDTEIRYTFDGSAPNGRSKEYRQPLNITGTATLRATLLREGIPVGPAITATFRKIELPEVQAKTVTIDRESSRGTAKLVGGLRAGARVYIDRDYGFAEVPEILKGSAYVMQPNDECGSKDDSWLTLTAVADVDVYMAHDKRIQPKPPWLAARGFQPRDLKFSSSDTSFEILHKRFRAGDTIALGGNTTDGEDGGRSNYAVVVKPVLTDPHDLPTKAEEVLPLLAKADPGRGWQIFFDAEGAQCAICHQIDGLGKNFGPELAGIGLRENAEAILQSILEPNARIVEGYRTHLIETVEGKSYAGMMLEESGLVLKLGQVNGESVTIRKADITSRKSADVSPMPPTVSVLLNAQQLADLTAFLVSCKNTPSEQASSSPIVKSKEVSFGLNDRQIEIRIDGREVAHYVFKDERIPRPFFSNIKTLDRIQVSRNHPPKKGQDSNDHSELHPGIWLAFGDIGGFDVWRNDARVVHEKFVDEPKGGKDEGSFTVVNRYESGEGKVICRETCRHTVKRVTDGYLITYASTFSSDTDFYFGDQEEMGLGIRITTPLTEERGLGMIRSSTGSGSAKKTWGQPAAWCDYSGPIEGRHAGIAILPSPDNFRGSWWHNRNYGAMVANAFGRDAMRQGEKSKVVVKAGEEFKLGYAVYVHSTAADSKADIAEVFKNHEK